MSIGTVFINNFTQAVRLPVDVRLPEGVHKVEVRVGGGHERTIGPGGQTWGSFFLGGLAVSGDFMSERSNRHQSEIRSDAALPAGHRHPIYVLKRRPFEVLATFMQIDRSGRRASKTL